MREKDDSARGKILEAAKAEFLERGFAEASMRTIAERAGFTTGMLYSRFADKGEIFRELVEGPADELYNYFMTVQNEFAGYSPEYQRREMHPYVAQKIDRMVDLIYDNFDAFKLILCKSGGTSYEYYVDKMIDVETESTFRVMRSRTSAKTWRICWRAQCSTACSRSSCTTYRGRMRGNIS